MANSSGIWEIDDESMGCFVVMVGFDTSGGNFLYLFRIDTLAPRIGIRTLFFSIKFLILSKRLREGGLNNDDLFFDKLYL